MAFGGVYAFPGGGVDPSDSDAEIGWAGPAPEWWARRLRLPVGEAQAVVCAAVREVFEEAGVLLAGASGDPAPAGLGGDLAAAGATGEPLVAGEVGDPRWEAARQALVARESSLTSFLAAEGLSLRGDLLMPWSRWITPEFEPRRFDTYFFLAVLPEGQLARDVSGEADHTMWIRPADAVRRCEAGELVMLPPTIVTLRQLAAYPDVAAVLAAAVDHDPGEPVRPRLVVDDDGAARLVLG